jgi:hypothetical protein
MVAFEVKVNGRKVCTAAVADFGVLSAILTCTQPRPERHAKAAKRMPAKKALGLHVGGLDSGDPDHAEHLTWIESALHMGDRVSILVLDAKRVDAPTKRYRLDPALEKEHREHFKRMKRHLRRKHWKLEADAGHDPTAS